MSNLVGESIARSHHFQVKMRDIPAIKSLYLKYAEMKSTISFKRAIGEGFIGILLVCAVGMILSPYLGSVISTGLGMTILSIYLTGLMMLEKKSKEGKVTILFLLINPGLFIYLAVFRFLITTSFFAQPNLTWYYFLFASLSGSFIAAHLVSTHKKKKLVMDPDEIKYVFSLVEYLKKELGPAAQISLSFNPHSREVGGVETPAILKRVGYTFKCYDDVTVDFKFTFSGQYAVHFQILTRSRDKVKNRKQKYKGTKLAIFYTFEIKNLKEMPFHPISETNILTPLNIKANKIKFKCSDKKIALLLGFKWNAAARNRFNSDRYLPPSEVWRVMSLLTKQLS